MARKSRESENTQRIRGRFQATSRGFGFLTPEGLESKESDYFIPPKETGGAWDGDTVEAVLLPPDPLDQGRQTARVVRVAQRANRTVVGVLRRRGREVWLQPTSDKLHEPIKVLGRLHGVGAGERAAVEMKSYGSAKLPPTGALRETFGREGTREAATASVLYQNGIDEEFPPAVLTEAAAAPQEVEPEALAGRLDLRGRTIITIDGEHSKDLDDAVSLWLDGEGRRVLGVHIADVSHYVTPGSALDGEAFQRGTSVYFADRVIPMLPVELSNGICSLNPRVDRLSLTCLMTLSPAGEVVEHSVHKSVIRSAERMTYENCNKLLAGGDAALEERYKNILPMLRDMHALSRQLERLRRLRGGLDLETSESEILCDGNGRPVDIVARRQGESEKLIESFMLLANETVAKHLFDRHKPAVYRVHEKPTSDKAEGLKTQLAPFGYAFQEADNFTLQKILDDARDKPEAPIISTLVLRSLMKARYDVQNLGHFGLAAKYYCHFTSPIRRYPDLMVHRILTRVIEDGPAGEGRTMPWEKGLAAAAQRAAGQSSEREIAAQNAEREIEKFYMAEYMAAHLGETMVGAVSGVTKFGLFIMLPSGVEGFLSVSDLPGDRWHCDDARMNLRGEHTGRTFSFGMALEVVCVAAEAGSGEISFRLAGEEIPEARLPQEEPRAQPRVKAKDRGRSSARSKPPRHRAGKGGRRRH